MKKKDIIKKIIIVVLIILAILFLIIFGLQPGPMLSGTDCFKMGGTCKDVCDPITETPIVSDDLCSNRLSCCKINSSALQGVEPTK
jgi:hypothetical protein